MNKKTIGFLLLFVVAIIAPTVFFTNSTPAIFLLFGAPVLGLLCAAVAGGLKAYMDTDDESGELTVPEKDAAILLGVAIFSIVSALILTVSLFEGTNAINYYFPSYGHVTEMTIRVIVAILLGATFFALNILLLHFIVPYIGREFERKSTELSTTPVAAAVAPTTPVVAPAAAATGTATAATGAAAATTTAAPAVVEPKKKGFGLTIPFIVILILAIIFAIATRSGNPTTPPVVTPPVVTQPTPPVVDPNAPIVLQDETGVVNQ